MFDDTFQTVPKINISVALSFFILKGRNANLGAELIIIKTKQQHIEGNFNFKLS